MWTVREEIHLRPKNLWLSLRRFSGYSRVRGNIL